MIIDHTFQTNALHDQRNLLSIQAGEFQQYVHHATHCLGNCQTALQGLLILRHFPGTRQANLKGGLNSGQRCAQLMGNISIEASFSREGVFYTLLTK
jgi:hypothetical protein